MRYTTVFFDLDDTLWDTKSNSNESLNQIFHSFSFDKYYDNYQKFCEVFLPYNLSLWKLYEQNAITKQKLMSERFFKPFQHVEGLTQQKAIHINNEYMELTASKSRMVEGAIEILEKLNSSYKLCIISNGFEEIQYKKLNNGKLNSYFEHIILSDFVGVNKPSPVIFQYAMKKMRTSPSESIMIGDNWDSDIVGAKNSSIDQIWFNPDNKPENGFTPTHIINRLCEIKDILLL